MYYHQNEYKNDTVSYNVWIWNDIIDQTQCIDMTDFSMKYCEDVFRSDYHASLTNQKVWQEYWKNICSFIINEIARKKVLWLNEKYY